MANPCCGSSWRFDAHPSAKPTKVQVRWESQTDEIFIIVVRGGFDGFSNPIVYLSGATNIPAATVLRSFLEAVSVYYVPSRLRIERLWRDVYAGLTDLYTIFTNLEGAFSLLTTKCISMLWVSAVTHTEAPSFFQRGWNIHTPEIQSPLQLWTSHEHEAQ
ncbi:hypothetical protein Q8A73_017725 [Channa argus]|nr:hypothetical protein Q8A73_017725 [Channa argus]